MKPVLGILGGGWLGSRVAAFFQNAYEVRCTTRAGDLPLNLDEGPGYFPALAKVDVLVITAPLHRITGYKVLPEVLGDFKGRIFYCSSTGIYPNKAGVYTEDDAEDSDLLAVEQFLQANFPSICILRLGGLMGDARYLAKFFKDRPLPQPGARVNYIHYQDILGILALLFEGQFRGEVFNVVAPIHPRKYEVFYAQTGVTVEGEPFERTVSCEKLTKKTGYRFQYPDPISFPFIRSL